ncbi:DUF86 domain-containing protein [Candidatus Parcubacteria bacterium]|nr:DUF86 domain-containing protein [Candidatus Parcubacteria bacterium]
MDKNLIYLKHIVDAINCIEDYIDKMDKISFENDRKTIDAVVRELEIIGEASNNLSEDIINKNPEISFRDAVDMRNILIHEYFGIDADIVWNTCKNDLPKLRKNIEKLLN